MQDTRDSAISPDSDYRKGHLCFAILSLMAPVFIVMAFMDFGDLFSSGAITQVSAKISYVRTQTELSMGRKSSSPIGSHAHNTIYLDGHVDGFMIPANIYTAPTREELREGRSATLGYYDNRIDCRQDGGDDWMWDAHHKTLYQGLDTVGEQSPKLSSGTKCYQVVSAAIDGTEYFSLWGFRGQIMLSVMTKLGIAAIFPLLWWFVANSTSMPLAPTRQGFEQPRIYSQEDFK